MAWQQTMVTMLRALVNDLDCTDFTNERLEQLLVVSAHYVNQEIDFNRNYTINITSPDVDPDPTTISNDSNNDAFINFVVLKAACLADWSTYRQKALVAGVKAKCGPAVLETMDHVKGFRDLIEMGPCKAYETLKWEHEMGNFTVKAVLSPFISNDFDPHSLWGGHHRRRSL